MPVRSDFKLIAFITALLLASFRAQPQDAVSYSRVDAIFQSRCVACHGHTSRASGLNLESFEALMNGGKRGAPVIAGRSSESLIVKFIDGTLKPRMPLGAQLSSDEISTIKAWIDAGAKGPTGAAMPEAPNTEATSKANLPDIRPTVPVKAAISSLAFHPNGTLIALGGYQNIELVGTDGKTVARLEGCASQVRGLAFSPDGKMLAAAGGSPGQFGEIKIWNVAERREVQSIRGHRDNIFAVAFSPDGRLLATCSYDRMIKLWDTTSGKEIRNLKDHTDAVFSLAFSPDGRLLASASADRTIKVWNVATGERLYTLGDGLDAMNTVTFHPSGKMLAGAGADRVIRLWEVSEKEGRQLRSLIAHEDAINQLVFSPDGKTLASTGADKVIKLWDAATLAEIKVLERQPDWVFAMAYAPDGSKLAVGRYDGSAVLYDLRSEKGVTLK
jgi:WD40 repeat protein